MKKLILLLLISFALGHAGATGTRHVLAQKGQPKDKIKETKTITGTLKGFQSGDYMHAVITKDDGEETSFFLPTTESVQYFLVAHKGQPLTLTYQVVDSYIEEAGGVQTIERLMAVKSGNLTDAAWWKKQRASYSLTGLRKKYEAMVYESMLND